mmetsp:Transcript_76981/g.213986  ORF Transcript_76981/g.213986 Transcript_76981/m.213986 type:complete len:360 (+) Transcript_76981:58-1137(+)
MVNQPECKRERSQSKRRPPSTLAGGRFQIHRKLGAGCFGEVYQGVDTLTEKEVAVKIEDTSHRHYLQLAHESCILNMLREPHLPQGFAENFYFGQEGHHQCLVMDLLGKSLEDLVKKCGGSFNATTTALVAEQVLLRIEYCHSKGVVHRDIKPENFVFGLGKRVHHLYLIDFGLSKLYWDKRHLPMKHKLSLTGTARYASINAHKGFEQSRRDDLEAIGHMLMYFLRGKLPWSGLTAKTVDEKYRRILEKKEQVSLKDLCGGYPSAFLHFLRYARGLGFTERPDYEMLQRHCKAVRQKEGVKDDHAFQWFEGHTFTESLEPLVRPRVLQPDAAEEKRTDCRRRAFFCICGNTSSDREPK